MNQHQAPANAMHLQQEVKSFFQNHSPADLEQDLYDLLQENQMLREVLMRLSKQLDKPFVGVVSLTSIEDANDRKQAIIADATMR